MNLKKQKGFTLIELMIVVAIIGILASIAIPQFSAFRIKAYNSASVSDLHSVRLGEELLYTDYTVYGASVSGMAQDTAIQATATGEAIPNGGSGYIALGLGGAAVPVTASSGVSIQTAVDTVWNGAGTPPAASYYTANTFHNKGDKLYVTEGDVQGIFQKGIVPGEAFAPLTAATTNRDSTSALKFIQLR